MASRARALKEAREAKRRALAEEKRRQQLRESCDDIRARDTMHITLVAAHERQQQVRERRRMEKEKVRGRVRAHVFGAQEAALPLVLLSLTRCPCCRLRRSVRTWRSGSGTGSARRSARSARRRSVRCGTGR